jgi:TetR/AcrR family transcriptional repressor of nem operon
MDCAKIIGQRAEFQFRLAGPMILGGFRRSFKKALDETAYAELTYQLVGMNNKADIADWPETKRKLVDASVALVRKQGYHATTVDHICSEAGVTKGGFFHYFKSKEDLAKATIEWFGENKAREFREAPFSRLADPLERIYGRLDYAKESVGGANRVTKGCPIGMIAQELASTHPAMRDVCQDYFSRLAKDLAKDLAEAKTVHAPDADFDPFNVAMLYVSMIQGSMMLAKTAEANTVLMENVEQFRRYLKGLFNQPANVPTHA